MKIDKNQILRDVLKQQKGKLGDFIAKHKM